MKLNEGDICVKSQPQFSVDINSTFTGTSPASPEFDGRQSPGRPFSSGWITAQWACLLTGGLTCLKGAGLNDLLSLRIIGGKTKDQPRSNEHP